MTTSVEEKVRPTVLLVEDNAIILKQREEVFRDSDFDTVVAQDYATALAKFRSTPSISLLATDINLDPDDDGNRGGLDLAEELHSIMPELPMIALSGRVSEKQFKSSRRARYFKDSLTKGGGLDSLAERTSEWRRWAVEYLAKRLTTRELELHKLKAKYNISDYDFDLMREFIPVSLESAGDLSVLLASKGFRLKIIEPTNLPEGCKEEGVRPVRSIPLWVHLDDHGATITEVYGFPQLYASGATENEATKLLLILMHEFFKDDLAQGDAKNRNDSALVQQMHHYLRSVFKSK